MFVGTLKGSHYASHDERKTMIDAIILAKNEARKLAEAKMATPRTQRAMRIAKIIARERGYNPDDIAMSNHGAFQKAPGAPVAIFSEWAPIWTYFLNDAFKAIDLVDRVPEEAAKK